MGEERREKRKRERREKSLGGFARKGERREVNGEKGNFRKYGCDLFIYLLPS